ncbi:UNVERIFIED_CONTAM: hypothetical protein QUG70_16915, partial [Acinetobacter lwoffii]
MIAIALTTTFFGYRVTFANEEPDTRKKVEPLPFTAVTVFAQFFKNKELFNSGLIMIVVSIVFGAVSTFVPLYTVKFGFADAGIFLTIQAIAVVLARIYLRKYIPSDGMWHPVYMVSVLMLLVIASMLVAIGPHIHVMMFYSSAILIGA